MSKINKNYTIKDFYQADTLVIANLEKIPSNIKDEFSPIIKKYKNKFIFELIKINGGYKYREIFTGFVTDEECDYFDYAYIVNPSPLTTSFSEYKGINISKSTISKIVREINMDNNKVLKKSK